MTTQSNHTRQFVSFGFVNKSVAFMAMLFVVLALSSAYVQADTISITTTPITEDWTFNSSNSIVMNGNTVKYAEHTGTLSITSGEVYAEIWDKCTLVQAGDTTIGDGFRKAGLGTFLFTGKVSGGTFKNTKGTIAFGTQSSPNTNPMTFTGLDIGVAYNDGSSISYAGGETGTLTLTDALYVGHYYTASFDMYSGTLTTPKLAMGAYYGNATKTGTLNLYGGEIALGSTFVVGEVGGASSSKANFNFKGGTLHTTASITIPSQVALSISADSTIKVDANTTTTVPNAFTVSGTPTLTKSGAGTLKFSNSNYGSSANLKEFVVEEGKVLVSASGYTWSTSKGFMLNTPITVKTGATLEYSNSWSQTGNATLTLDGGTLIKNNKQFLNSLNLNNGTIGSSSTVGKGDGQAIRTGLYGNATWNVTGGTSTVYYSVTPEKKGSYDSFNINIAEGATLDLKDQFYGVIDGSTSYAGTKVTINGIDGASGTFKFSDNVFGSNLGTITNNATIEYNVSDGKSVTESNVISGSGNLLKTGAGELILNAYNTYTGSTTVEDGTLTLNKTGNTGTLAAGTTLNINGENSVVKGAGNFLGYRTGSVGTINITDGGTLYNTSGETTLGNRTTPSDAHLNMTAGNIQVDGSGIYFHSTIHTLNGGEGKTDSYIKGTNIYFGENCTIDTDEGSTLNISAKIINASYGASTTMQKNGKGTLVLSATNTYTYDTVINDGTIKLTEDGTLGDGNVTNNGTLEFAHTNEQTFSKVISGTGTVKKTGTGDLILTQRNTYTGDTIVTDGTLTLQATGDGSNSGTLYKGTTLTASGSNTIVQAAGGDVLGYYSNAVGTINLKDGATLKNTSTSKHITLSSVVNLESGNIVATGNGDTFGAYVFDNQINAKSGESTISGGQISFRTGTFNGFKCIGGQIDVAEDAKLTISSVVKNDSTTNSSSLTKTGDGELILNAYNTYTGETKVNGGTLTLQKTGQTGTLAAGSTVTVDGATSVLQGNGDILGYGNTTVGTINLNNGGKFKNNSTNAHITVGATINMNNGVIEASGTGNKDVGNFIFDAPINVTGGTNNKITAEGGIYFRKYSGTPGDNGGNITVATDAKLTINSKIISGSLPLNKKGNGTLVLTESVSTNIDLSAGTLEFSPASGTSMTASGIISGSAGTLIKTGDGELILTQRNTYSGNFEVKAGTLTLQKAGDGSNSGTLYKGTTLTASGSNTVVQANGIDALGYYSNAVGTINLKDGATLKNTSTTNHITLSSVVNLESGNIVATGNGGSYYGAYVFDNQINAKSGESTISGGQITFRSGKVTETFTCTGGNIDVAKGAKLTISSLIRNKTASDLSAMTKTGDGELVLTQRNTYTGGTTVTGGTLTLQAAGDNDNPGTLYKGTTLTASGSNTIIQVAGIDALGYYSNSVGTINLKDGATLKNTSATKHVTVSAVVNLESGNILGSGNGSSTYGEFVFDNKINALSGDSTISGGPITFRSGKVSETFTCTGGQIEVAKDATLTISSVVKDNSKGSLHIIKTGEGTLKFTTEVQYRIEDNAGIVEFAPAENETMTISQIISGNGSVTKSGDGELILTQENTYSGGTTITGGTLTLQKTGTTGTLATGSTVTVDGATSVLQGHGDILGYDSTTVGTINLNNGGKFKNDSTNAHITVGATINMNNGIIEATGAGSNAYNNFVFDAPFNVTGGTDNVINAEGGIHFRKFGSTPGDGGGLITVAQDAVLTINSNIKESDYQPLTKKGVGTLVLSKKNDYIKGTKIDEGVLKLTENGTLGSGSVALTNGTLEFAHDSDITFGNTISGTGNLLKTGTGVLYLNGTTANPITASSFDVDAGTLMFKGQYTGNLSINGESVFSPGNSVGTLEMLNGNFALNDTSTAQFEFGTFVSGEYDSITLDSGQFDLSNNSTVEILFTNDDASDWALAGQKYYLINDSDNTLFNPDVNFVDDSGLFSLFADAKGLYVMATPTAGVPEPSTWALLILGFADLMWLRKRNGRR